MRWVWDPSADNRVVQLWDLRERLSRTKKVVYIKWFQNRATFFSLEVFAAMLSVFHRGDPSQPQLSENVSTLLDVLVDNSPQTTKALKRGMKAEFGWSVKEYDHAMKELWHRGLIAGCGEVDDGAFPSLNVGATELLFEEIWEKSHTKNLESHLIVIEKFLPDGSPWQKYFKRVFPQPVIKKKSSGKGLLRYHELVKK